MCNPIILDGKKRAAKIRSHLKQKVAQLKSKPGLSVVLVGQDPASQIYVSYKEKACQELGINSVLHHLPEDTSEKKLLGLIKELNQDPYVHGILVQLPLPRHINADKITLAIDYHKDVDGFHPINIGNLFLGKPCLFKPCTPSGIMTLLDPYTEILSGKEAVVVGRSNIVGKPMAALLLRQNCTVTICHSRTQNLIQK